MPMDFADEAQEIAEIFLDNSLKSRRILTIPFSGFCLCCNTHIGDRRFCDSTCREIHEATLKRRMISGTDSSLTF